jgi:Ca-activated chloride channel family protein
MRSIHHLFLGLIGAVGATALLAQEPVFNLRVDVQLVSLDVTVTDAQSQPITNLVQRDFTLVEDGVEQQIKSFNALDTPYNILLLFDRSGSTAEQWKTMQRASATFIRNLRKQDRVALGAFDDGLTMLSAWTDTRSATDRALESVIGRGPGGGTNLYWSLERATQHEFRNVEGRKAVVVLTDGRDNSVVMQTARTSLPKTPANDPLFQNTMTVVRESRVPVYFVAINTDKNPTDLGSDYYEFKYNRFPNSNSADMFLSETRKRMELLSDASGGRVFFPKKVQDIVPVYDQISRDMSTAYSFSYVSSNRSEPGQSHKIEVRVRRNGARVRQSRDGYVTP